MRVAITGSSGFIGSRLVAQLSQDPDVEAIVGLDVAPPREPAPKLSFVKQDVTQPMDPAFRAQRVDAAVHLAFIVDPMHDERRMTEINIRGTENFIAACAAAAVWYHRPRPLRYADYALDLAAVKRDLTTTAHPIVPVVRALERSPDSAAPEIHQPRRSGCSRR